MTAFAGLILSIIFSVVFLILMFMAMSFDNVLLVIGSLICFIISFLFFISIGLYMKLNQPVIQYPKTKTIPAIYNNDTIRIDTVPYRFKLDSLSYEIGKADGKYECVEEIIYGNSEEIEKILNQ